MANTKLTRVMAIDNAINGIIDEETIEVLNKIKASFEKKSTSKPKALSDEQTAIRNAIVEVLTETTVPVSISEMQKLSEVLAPCSTSKISGNLTPMLEKNGGNIVRTMDKKTAKFIINE